MIFFMFNGSGNIEVIIIEVFKLNGPFDEEAFGSRLSLELDDSSPICIRAFRLPAFRLQFPAE